ncbi:MAG: hypothetical protein ACK5XA_15770 [Tagaea sp.]
MLIECLIKRPGGSVVELFGTEYHFVPAIDGCHVCDVEDPAAVDRLLQIPEGYRLARETSILADDAPTKVDVQPQSPWNPSGAVANDELPDGAPPALAAMTREQLFAYAQKLGMRKPTPNMREDKLRANIALFLEQRLAFEDEPAPAAEPEEPGVTVEVATSEPEKE